MSPAVVNMHERWIPAGVDAVGKMIDTLGSDGDVVWPRERRPALKLDRPLPARATGGFLFVDSSIPLLFPGTVSIAIAPASDAEAVIPGFGRGMGETLREVTVNGETMLSYSGYSLRKTGK